MKKKKTRVWVTTGRERESSARIMNGMMKKKSITRERINKNK